MTKIVLTKEPSPEIPTAIAALSTAALVAYSLPSKLLYVRDEFVPTTISYLASQGIQAQIVMQLMA